LLAAARAATSTAEVSLEGDPLFACRLKPVCKLKCSLSVKVKGRFNLPDKIRKIPLRNHAVIALILG